MKFTEKAEEVRAIVKNDCKQGVNPRFASCGISAEKAGKYRKKPALFPTSSGIFRNRFRKKFRQNHFDLCGFGKAVALLPLFPASLRVHRRARPIAEGKNAGDDAA